MEKVSLVTGACGFAGSHMVKLLLEKGKKVRATDLKRTCHDEKIKMVRENIGLNFERDGVEFIPSDLTQKETLYPALKDVDVLYHTASLYDYSAPMEALERVNIFGTKNICEVAIEQDIERMIHWSTAGVYGHPYMPRSFHNPLRPAYELFWGSSVRPWLKDKEYKRPKKYPANQPFTEESSNPLNTPGDEPIGTFLVNDYSITKWKQEQIVYSFYKEHNLPVTIIRPAPLYGPGSDYGIGGILLAAAEGLTYLLPCDLKHYSMPKCHTRDIVRAAEFLAERPETIGEAYNVSDDTVISQREFLEVAALLVGRKVYHLPFVKITALFPLAILGARYVAWLERHFKRYQRLRVFEESSARYISSSYVISNLKIKSLGFQLEYPDFKVGLRDAVEWFVKVGWIK